MTDSSASYIPLNAITTTTNFQQMAEGNPCEGCSAYCCRILLIPYTPPKTFNDLDYVRYMLGFPNIEMFVTQNGNWKVAVLQNCTLFDDQNNLCTVHGTPRQPKVCVKHSPYQCWYKRNFHGDPDTTEILRFNSRNFEAILAAIQLDAAGNITYVPDWDTMHALIQS